MIRCPRRTLRGRPNLGCRALKDNADNLSFQFGGPRFDCDRAVADRKFSWVLNLRPLSVPEVVQAIDELAVRERLAASDLERTREHARKDAVPFAVQPRID